MKRRHLFSLLTLTVPMSHAHASNNCELFGVVLLQPEAVLKQRLAGVEPLVSYIKALEVAVTGFAGRHDRHSPSSGFVVLAIRPNHTSHFWLDLEQPLGEAPANELISALQKVPTPAVTQGTIALAIKVGLWGGGQTARATPMPAEWRAAVDRAGRPLEVTELIDLVWK